MAYIVPRQIALGLLISHAAMLGLALGSSDIWFEGWRIGGFGVIIVAAISAVVGLVLVVSGALQRSPRDVGWGATVLALNVVPYVVLSASLWHFGD
jgi:hypothetical protein